MENIKCDVCGFDMTGDEGKSEVALMIQVHEGAIEYARFKEMFGVESVCICSCCWVKSLGVKPI